MKRMNIEDQIQLKLTELEESQNFVTLIAVESGSRAWGFPSADSDYDVRVIYLHPPKQYLTIFNRKDHLNLPINDVLDIAGWDFRKLLLLLYKGNAVAHEWLHSPIVYRQEENLVPELKAFAAKVFNPKMALRHYVSMAAKKLDFSDNNHVTAKRLLYGFRTLLCAKWVAEEKSAPPMEFDKLLTRFIEPGSEIRKELSLLIEQKSKGSESDEIAISSDLYDFGQSWIKSLKLVKLSPEPQLPDVFDEFFKQILEQYA